MLIERLKPMGHWIYSRVPKVMQESVLSGYFNIKSKHLYGETYRQQFELLQRSQWFDRDELANLQSRWLQRLVVAAARTPHYEKLFRCRGISCKDLMEPDDLKVLPTLEKETLRRTPMELVDSAAGQTLEVLTSGTTGTPLRIYQSRQFEPYEEAFIERQYAWTGYRSSDRHVKMRGDLVVRAGDQTSLPWRLVRSLNELRMSSFHLSSQTVHAYVDQIRAFEPRALIAYGSSAALLASLVREQGIECRIPLVFLSSETLSAAQRRVIEETFDASVFEHYGQTEGVAMIQQCEKGTYHIIPEYGITELLPVEEHGDTDLYEIVATGFWNQAMPLLRYRTGDLVKASREQTCPCGRAFRIVAKVIGRQDDMLLSHSGALVGRLHHVFLGLAGVIEAQIRQFEDTSVTVVVVPSAGFDQRTQQCIVERLLDRLGPLQINIERVSRIPRDASGKFRAVTSAMTQSSNP